MKNSLKLFLVICLYIILNLPFLATFPPVNNLGDESWKMNTVMELITSGRPVASMFPHTPMAEEVQVSTVWLYNLILGALFYIFGPSIWIGRFLSFLCGIIVIVLIYRFGKDVANEQTGLFASVLLSISIVFSWHSRELRPDMMLMAFVTFSVYLFYLGWLREKAIYLFISGFIITLALQVHPNSVIFAVSMPLVFIYFFRENILSRSAVALVTGLISGFALWILFNFLPYSLASFQTVHQDYMPPIMRKNFFVILLKSLMSLPLAFGYGHLKEVAEKYHSYFGIGMVYFGLVSVLISFFSGGSKKKLSFLLSFIAVPFVISFFVTGSWNWFHFSVFVPIASVALAIAIFDISRNFHNARVRRFFPGVVMMAVAFLGISDIVANNIEMMKYDHKVLMQSVSERVPEGATVLGTSFYYPAFLGSNRRFVGILFIKGNCPDFSREIDSLGI
jgi:4-amino-4-deoxy-L-arabinose transferase-like glycosyltransferase